MSLRRARVGVGEWIILVASLALVVDLFIDRWFSVAGPQRAGLSGSRSFEQSGWEALHWLGPFGLVAACGGIAVWSLTGLRRSPAMPVVATILLTPLAIALAIGLLIRTVIAQPDLALAAGPRLGPAHTGPAGYVGLGCAVVLVAGIYVALRREGLASGDGPTEIETIRLGSWSDT